ncbi:MAG TPA: glycosyl hydrolase 53 family protein [Puia sp.]|nr:glycosyl hydrolase 53 family protein [Puia sp.]
MRHLLAGLFLVVLAACCAGGCKKRGSGGAPADTTKPVMKDTPVLKGADVSWLTQMEDSGWKFYDSAGAPTECMRLLKGLGIDLIRLRVWVDPATKYNGTADVVAKAVRAKSLGLKLLIDFHYSDTWADPAHQAKPAAWSRLDFAGLTDTVTGYTEAVLDSLKAAGALPDYVQVGNETDNGMLWPDGQASTNMADYAALVNAGYRGVKAVSDSIKVIVHLSNGYDNAHFEWLFDGLKANGANWDVIGMSMYPSASAWAADNEQCLANMNDMVARYHKPVMICEVGMPENEAATCAEFITDLIHKVRAVQGGNGLGVLYWEPECYHNWQGYGLGAFDDTGKPTVAMDAFRN